MFFGEANPLGVYLPVERKAVQPIPAPYFNEVSFVTTDARFWYVRHNFPGDALTVTANVYAVQLHAALTDSIQFVAYKDG